MVARLEGLVRLSALTLGAFVLVVVTFLSGVAARGAPVPAEDAKALAASFVSHEAAGGQAYREAVRLPGQVAFQKSTELRNPATGDLLAYVFELEPQGFIVVTVETRLLPVVAYSDTAQFSWEESPLNALLWILRTDLRLRMRALAEGVYAEGEIERNEARWAEYLSTEGPALADSTWGPWITFPTWNQRAPYWDSCPLDPVTGERCVVGCGATALSQILNYWRSPTAVTFTAADNYTSIKNPDDGKGERVIPIDAEGASIPLISYGGGVPSDATKAAISFAAGVSVQMCYSSAASGSNCTNIASSLAGGLPAWSWIVPEHWQYVSADYRTTDVSWQPWPPYYATVEEIYGLLQADAASSHPAIVLIRSDAGGTLRHRRWLQDDRRIPRQLRLGWVQRRMVLPPRRAARGLHGPLGRGGHRAALLSGGHSGGVPSRQLRQRPQRCWFVRGGVRNGLRRRCRVGSGERSGRTGDSP